MVYIIFYYSDLYYCLTRRIYTSDNEVEEDFRDLTTNIALKCVCLVFTIAECMLEINSLKGYNSGFKDYILDLWNIIDLGLILIYVPMALIDLFGISNKTLVILQVLYTFLIFSKLIYFLRVSY